MRLNQFVAQATGLSRRAADSAITSGQISVNGAAGQLGQTIEPDQDQVNYQGQALALDPSVVIIYHKPTGLITSRRGQGQATIYDRLPKEYQALKPAGRLDRDSSGLMVLSNDGQIIQRLIHPSAGKAKRYQVELDRAMTAQDLISLQDGIQLAEGLSRLRLLDHNGRSFEIELVTGWNRQIRRSFEALGYRVTKLHRTAIGLIALGDLGPGAWRPASAEETAWLKS